MTCDYGSGELKTSQNELVGFPRLRGMNLDANYRVRHAAGADSSSQGIDPSSVPDPILFNVIRTIPADVQAKSDNISYTSHI